MSASNSIEIFVGPMYSGKTSALLKRAEELERSAEVHLFKPAIDTRYNKNKVCAHTGDQRTAERITNVEEIVSKISPGSAVIIDEIQFFPGSLKKVVGRLSESGHQVVLGGLLHDFEQREFETTRAVLNLASNVRVLTSTCACCGQEATHTYKSGSGSMRVEIGGADIYEPRCAACYEKH